MLSNRISNIPLSSAFPVLKRLISLQSKSANISALQQRWQQIRVFEIQRQLLSFSGQEVNIYVKNIAPWILIQKDHIVVSTKLLNEPLEVIAAMLAFKWAQSLVKPPLLRHRFAKRARYHESTERKCIRFAARFLAKHRYPIQKIIGLTLKDEQVLSFKGHTNKEQRAKLMMAAYQKAIQIEQKQLKAHKKAQTMTTLPSKKANKHQNQYCDVA